MKLTVHQFCSFVVWLFSVTLEQLQIVNARIQLVSLLIGILAAVSVIYKNFKRK